VGIRRQAREAAVQMLYAMDLNTEDNLDEACKSFWNRRKGPAAVREFANRLTRSVVEHRPQLDEIISKYCTTWDFDRVGAIERNVLRLALYEILHCDDIPHQVSINEAIEIAKLFGTDKSGAFVNGLLDAVVKDL